MMAIYGHFNHTLNSTLVALQLEAPFSRKLENVFTSLTQHAIDLHYEM